VAARSNWNWHQDSRSFHRCVLWTQYDTHLRVWTTCAQEPGPVGLCVRSTNWACSVESINQLWAWTNRTFIVCLHAAASAGISAPRQKEQLSANQSNERKALTSNSAEKGVNKQEEPQRATSRAQALQLPHRSKQKILWGATARLQFSAAVLVYIFSDTCQRPAVCAWRNSDDDGTAPPLRLWFDNLNMSNYFIGPPAPSVRGRCTRRLHHKARHLGVRATAHRRPERLQLSPEEASSPGNRDRKVGDNQGPNPLQTLQFK